MIRFDDWRISNKGRLLVLCRYYTLQLRATQGVKVQHTNVIRAYVPESLPVSSDRPEL